MYSLKGLSEVNSWYFSDASIQPKPLPILWKIMRLFCEMRTSEIASISVFRIDLSFNGLKMQILS